jgi:hypothetical protein
LNPIRDGVLTGKNSTLRKGFIPDFNLGIMKNFHLAVKTIKETLQAFEEILKVQGSDQSPSLLNPYQFVSGCFLLLLNKYHQKKTHDVFE